MRIGRSLRNIGHMWSDEKSRGDGDHEVPANGSVAIRWILFGHRKRRLESSCKYWENKSTAVKRFSFENDSTRFKRFMGNAATDWRSRRHFQTSSSPVRTAAKALLFALIRQLSQRSSDQLQISYHYRILEGVTSFLKTPDGLAGSDAEVCVKLSTISSCSYQLKAYTITGFLQIKLSMIVNYT